MFHGRSSCRLQRSRVLPDPRNEIIVRQPISGALHRNFERNLLAEEISPNHRSLYLASADRFRLWRCAAATRGKDAVSAWLAWMSASSP